MQYYPFGSVRSGRVSTDRGFTGQRREGFSRLGAYFYNACFYATGLGHFMSADTSSTDGLARYAYVRFNPMRYVDPDSAPSARRLRYNAGTTAGEPEHAFEGTRQGPARNRGAARQAR